MTTEIVGLEQHGFVADITCRAGKLQFISQTGFGIRSCVQMDVTDTTQQFIGFGLTLLNAQHVIFDVKAIFEKNVVDGRL